MKKSLLIRLHSVFLIATALFAGPYDPAQGGDVYRWKDNNGRTYYSDHAVEGAERTRIDAAPTVHVVKRVFDGDTVLLNNGEKVRLLGINTPEVDSPRKIGEPGGEEAKLWLQQRLSGRTVRLEQDGELRDKYQRLLAHVFTASGQHINLALVEAGLAFVDIHPPNLKYTQALTQAENRAEQARRGIWGMTDYRPKPVEALIARPMLRGWQRLTGVPSAIIASKRYLRLKFSDRFEVHIERENLNLFPPLENYLHRNIEVRGWLSRRRGDYSIFVRHPSALVALIDGNPAFFNQGKVPMLMRH
ncbi:thermonuclease family protein [Methylocaldum sp.]|uniref:thermonuclease family protein n=1 Tax=Methylocaldum sp. TaxID=1969727 RepID=UPI002D29B8DD|nr:thermonuclease family protein [Methylocaldum sp.]HYE35221.1 thermonuclease family protein [Methylocaldum sp.]